MNDDADFPCRLAFREEGEFVNCYLALKETMEGAVLLSSMRTPIVIDVFEDWKDLMRRQMTAAIKDVFGAEVLGYEEQNAPEHERSGRA